jgi:hypothetical protein
VRIIHVLRKPLSEGTVASNVLKHGCGGVNIDGSRVHSGPSSGGSISGATALGQASGWNAHANHTTQIDRSMSAGRWPANLILQHLDGCKCEGTRQVKPSNGSGKAGAGSSGFQSAYVGGDSKAVGFTGGSVAGDGKETVADWICAPGCSVDALDEQSGSCSPDTGGASRFFKQVGGKK